LTEFLPGFWAVFGHTYTSMLTSRFGGDHLERLALHVSRHVARTIRARGAPNAREAAVAEVFAYLADEGSGSLHIHVLAKLAHSSVCAQPWCREGRGGLGP
jgi:hypothetical protein